MLHPCQIKPRTICCQEGENDGNMPPTVMTTKIKIREQGENSVYFEKTICTVFTIYGTSTHGNPTSTWSRSSWKLNFRFVVSPTLLDCEGRISFI
uniref:Uncharacterized protein n=1 Tax=Arundo donax TaxID=35708 RepID=A0A0A9GTD6_ARUDO